jgi:quinol monooxygenase YgiN
MRRMTMPVAVVTIHPKPGKLDEVVDMFKEEIPIVHDQPGCELFALHKTDDRVVLIEIWSSDETMRANANRPDLPAFSKRLADVVVGGVWDAVVLEPVPAGDPAKATVGIAPA